ncbi:ribonuclease HII [Rehaibacterium terrae]|jgi:ribonuclease HII|uniref:Ribonuclease HII n=1 Tax=Rehaibacterium terrae TaxID=1341696 RepID=A0A7W8DD00_9GAMM|nr:ribonuclease HII [Rehaibacterium terrae]MBB5014836.1 ribonuclease HII [Rehaibacterium terrae]
MGHRKTRAMAGNPPLPRDHDTRRAPQDTATIPTPTHPAPVPGTAGVDEAGRGPLAGPLVVAAVILDPQRPIDGLGDSKRLSEAQREALFPLIVEWAVAYRIEIVAAEEIDRLNIFRATLEGMRRAVAGLSPAAAHALIDGNRVPPGLPCPAEAIVGGDARVPAIGAASILAKVARDRLMLALDDEYPGYGFARHKGYPTPEHLACLDALGPCPAHRRSFAPVKRAMARGLFD